MMKVLQSLFNENLSTSAVPIALTIWLLQHWWSSRNRRLNESRIALMYLKEIKQEVEVGADRLCKLYCNGGRPDLKTTGSYHPKMPTACWIGVRDILPDDIYHRICLVAAYDNKDGTIKDLRWHLKNYYTVICEYGNNLLLEKDGINTKFEKNVVRAHLDGAKMVVGLLEDACNMMEHNLQRNLFPR